ncbi:hypothetical protein D3093_16755 (plasmid) [Azospirillum argentinense]|uniref:Uncharacterized protein n=1 Tax=Azospirillum argentinense TaxID=2970906 RepID=A0A4D8PHU7_9PROT|nr:hypothetical protein D3093_16755 [Azospirillum argentinense]
MTRGGAGFVFGTGTAMAVGPAVCVSGGTVVPGHPASRRTASTRPAFRRRHPTPTSVPATSHMVPVIVIVGPFKHRG